MAMKRRKLAGPDVTERLRLIEDRMMEEAAGSRRTGGGVMSADDHLHHLLRMAEQDGVDLSPWAKRIRALEGKLAVHEVMRS